MNFRSKYLAIVSMLLGIGVLVAQWGNVTRYLVGGGGAQQTLTLWSNSGTPEFEKSLARDYDAAYPGKKVNINFAQVGSMSDVVWAGFVSGNAPDVVLLYPQDIRERVAAGFIRPLDDLVERQLRERPEFLKNRIEGKLSLFRFYVDPNDRFLRQPDLYPEESKNLKAMNGKIVGIRGGSGCPTLTYNRRIFRDAAKRFPDAGLLDDKGEPKPPATWSELRRVAKVITDYGVLAEAEARATGKPFTRPYGLVIQGQRPRDITRSLDPLYSAAGSRGFDFRGSNWMSGGSERAGRYDFENPAILAAFKLMVLMQRDGSILPGTTSRQYEDVRTQVALGTAAMLIDAWYATLIGKDRVPWAKDDLGSAPIPVPDDAAEAMLGIKLQRGVAPRSAGGEVACITSRTKLPWDAWNWIVFSDFRESIQRRGSSRGGIPGTYSVAAHLDDPNWFPFAYQRQVWDVLLNHSSYWAEAPVLKPVQKPTLNEVLHTAMQQATSEDPDVLLRRVRADLSAYSAAVNKTLEDRVRAGEEDPAKWTIPDFDPRHPEIAFFKQQEFLEKKSALMASAQNSSSSSDEPDALISKSVSVALVLAGLVSAVMLMLLKKRRGGERTIGGTCTRISRSWASYIFVAPAVMMLIAFVVYPAIYQMYLCFHSGQGVGPMRYVGWENFKHIRADEIFWKKVVPNTLTYTVVVTIVQAGLGLLLACLLNVSLRASGFLRMLFFIPLITSLSAVSVTFIGLLGGENSVVNGVLNSCGLANLPYWLGYVNQPGKTLDWLGDPHTDLWCVLLVSIWHSLPYTIILFLAGLQSIPADLYEAAKVDGAGAWSRFRHVTIPELAPVTGIIVFNSFIGAAKAMTVVLVMTGGGGATRSSEVVASYIFKWGFTRPLDQQPDIGYASALGIVYAILLGSLVLVNLRFIRGTTFTRFLSEGTPSGGTDTLKAAL